MEKARETFCLFLSTFFLFLSKKRHRKMLIGKKNRAQNMGPDTIFSVLFFRRYVFLRVLLRRDAGAAEGTA